MRTASQSHTSDSIFTSLGYPDPMVAARQQARMILLGRKSRYQAEIRQMADKWGCTLDEMHTRYTAQAIEDFDADDDYLQWQWYADSINTINAQLSVLAGYYNRATSCTLT